MLFWVVENKVFLRQFLAKQFPTLSNRGVKRLLDEGRCLVNGSVERFGRISVYPKDQIQVLEERKKVTRFDPLCVVVDEEHFLVYAKPEGMLSDDPALLESRYLVHRLDRETSGLLLLAKTPLAERSFLEQFRQREVEKTYFAWVEGEITPASGVIDGRLRLAYTEGVAKRYCVHPTEGKEAITLYETVKKKGGGALYLSFSQRRVGRINFVYTFNRKVRRLLVIRFTEERR